MNTPSPLPAYLKRRSSEETYVGTTASGNATGIYVAEYGQLSFVLEDLSDHAIWVPIADGEAVSRDEADSVVAHCWERGRPLDYGCHRMVTGRGLPGKPLYGFAGDDRKDAGPVEPVDYVSVRFVPYMGQWSQAEPEDIAGELADGRAERGSTAAEEPPDLEIRVPLPEAMYTVLAERVRTGTTPVTGALILSMAQLMPTDATDRHKGAPLESSDGYILAAASGERYVTLVSLSLHGPGALSPRMATTLWPAPCETDADPANDT